MRNIMIVIQKKKLPLCCMFGDYSSLLLLNFANIKISQQIQLGQMH